MEFKPDTVYRYLKKSTDNIIPFKPGDLFYFTSYNTALFLLESGTLLYFKPESSIEAEELQMSRLEWDLWVIEQQKRSLNTTLRINAGQGTAKIGADPEIFAVDETNTVIPAWEWLPPKPSYSDIIKPYWDGFQAEFTIPPDLCHGRVMDSIQRGLCLVLGQARAKNPKARLVPACVVDIPYTMMEQTTNEHAGLGCSPSKNVYGVAPLEVNGRELPFRFAGCHIHYSLKDNIETRVKAIDRIAGPILVSLLNGIDDTRRRRFYGRAGEYRTPKHGFEYRVLSSATLCHPIITNLAFDICRLAAANPNYTSFLSTTSDIDNRVQHIINDCDIDDARAFLNENRAFLNCIIKSLYDVDRGNGPTSAKKQEYVLEMIMKGCKEFIPVHDMEASWNLTTTWQRHTSGPNKSVSTLVVK